MHTNLIGADIITEAGCRKILSDIRRNAYKFIGEGSGRVVYDQGDGYVVKAAKNYRGIAQNEAEQTISADDHSGLFARVIGVSANFDLLLMEKAEKIRYISSVWDYFNVRSNLQLFQTRTFQDIAKKHGLILIDFGRASSWGKINGRLVIIDYGFTWKVKRRYY